jgi:hypothetical protein
VQGPIYSRSLRIRVSLAVGVAFVTSATAVFALVSVLARLAGVGDIALDRRIVVGAIGLLALAALDVRAITRSTYCPLGWRRQTPKSLAHRRSATLVASAWGFDTGLAVTTVRVAAMTWGAVLLAGLGLSAWFAGLGYGLGFALPFVVLLWTHRVGRAARSTSPLDPGLESMLARRKPLQVLSATLLALAGALLLGLVVLA